MRTAKAVLSPLYSLVVLCGIVVFGPFIIVAMILWIIVMVVVGIVTGTPGTLRSIKVRLGL